MPADNKQFTKLLSQYTPLQSGIAGGPNAHPGRSLHPTPRSAVVSLSRFDFYFSRSSRLHPPRSSSTSMATFNVGGYRFNVFADALYVYGPGWN